MQTPKITVTILSYNFEKYIGECIESVLGQTLRPAEIIIADDCSSDRSWEIISGYQRRNPDLIRCVRQSQNVGQRENAKTVLAMATGELITTMDGDDRLLSRKLELEWKALERNPGAGIAYSNVHVIDETGARTDVWYDGSGAEPPSGDVFMQAWSWSCFAKQRAPFRNELMYRDIFNDVQFPGDDVNIFLDLDFKIRVSARYHVIYTGEALVEYRVHGGGIHNRPLEEIFNDLVLVYFRNFPLLASRTPGEVRTGVARAIERIYSLVVPIQTVCDERLQLIERLDAECKNILRAAEERLVLIHRLDEEHSALRKRITELERTCDNRLAVINDLQKASQRSNS